MQDQRPRRAATKVGGYYWDKSTLENRQRTRLQLLERENYTPIADFDNQILAQSLLTKHTKRSSISSPPSSTFSRANRKETRLLISQKLTLADIQAAEMQRTGSEQLEYHTCLVGESKLPRRSFCSICGYWGTYTCVECGVRYCSLVCKATHVDTRCLKHVI